MTRVSSLAVACDGAIQLFRRQPRFGKFIAIGCINAVVSYSIFTLAHFMTHADRLSVVITWCVGIVFNFFSTGRLVFESRDLHWIRAYLSNARARSAKIPEWMTKRESELLLAND